MAATAATRTTSTIFAIATGERQAVDIMNQLWAAGFARTDISVIYPEARETYEEADGDEALAMFDAYAPFARRRRLGGGLLGGAVGWLHGLCRVQVEGLGVCIAAGPLATALHGVENFGVVDALALLGVNPTVGEQYRGRLRHGHVLIGVHAEFADGAHKAMEIFAANAAFDVVAIKPVRSASGVEV